MGRVFLARAISVAGIEKYCVVKTVKEDLAGSGEHSVRFLDEARVVVHMNHRNICSVFDVGEVDGVVYLAMDLIAGKDLRSITEELRKRAQILPLPIALRIVRELLLALDYAHRRTDPSTGNAMNVVHRDVSPHNVMLSFEGEVKLIDFGLANSVHKRGQEDPKTVYGKLRYMSPEQAAGKELDATTDLYATAILAYELITGHDYYDGMSLEEIWKRITQGIDPTRGWAEVDPAIAVILQTVLRHDAAQRTVNGAQFRQALEDYERTHGIASSEDDLREFLAALFPSGAADHQAMLRRLSTTGTSLRSADSDSAPAALPGNRSGETEVLQRAPGRNDTALTGALPAASSGRRSRAAGLGAVAAGLLAVAGAVLLSRAGDDSTRELAAAPPEEGATAVEASEPPVPAHVRVTFASTPPGATVLREGREEPLGVTPFSLELERSTEAVTYTVSLEGYQDEQVRSAPREDGELAVVLKPAEPERKRRTSGKRKRRRSKKTKQKAQEGLPNYIDPFAQ